MKRGLIGVIVAAGCLAWPAIAGAVTPTQTTCAGLPAAMNAATPGEVLQLPAGTCSTNVTVTNTNAFTLEGASTGATILEPSSTSTPTIGSNVDAHFTISHIEFTGWNGNAAVSLSNSGGAGVTLSDNTFTSPTTTSYAVNVNGNATASTEEVVITGNSFAHDGHGAIETGTGESLSITNNIFTDDHNPGGDGGGLQASDYNPSLNHVVVSGNTFDGDTTGGLGGGAAFLLGGGMSLSLTSNRFEDNGITGNHTGNGPREGGGLWVGLSYESAPFSVTQSGNKFTGNVISETEKSGRSTDPANGAGEWISGLHVLSTGDVFTGNRIAVDDGPPPEGGGVGAIASAPASPTPAEPGAFVGRDDLFSGNSTAAGGWGGAIYVGGPTGDCTTSCPGSSVGLQDSTVVNNTIDSGDGQGGAIWGSPNDTLSISNSIVHGNVPSPEIYGFASNPPTIAHSDICGIAGTSDICADPKLSSSGAETASSPTIDVGANSLVPAGLNKDLAGDARILASRATCAGKLGPAVVDMGAYEFTGVVTKCNATVKIKSSKLAAHNRKTKVKLSCPDGYKFCAGTVTITAKHGGKTIKLASAHFKIKHGKRAKVLLKLSKKALKKLGNPKSLKIKVKVSDNDAAGNAAKSGRKLKLKIL